MSKPAILIQYIIVREDLKKKLNWPTGAVIAQCCHATAAVLQTYIQDEATQAYLKDLDNMRKVVLGISDDKELMDLSKTFVEHNIHHKLWIEMPENIPTCIAVKPYEKEEVHKHLKHLKLLK